ncbi:MAG TPA: hypothetical protein VG369_05155, partial [Humibacter sp.]|nr:hypothetical protein [Humibacter sp.]
MSDPQPPEPQLPEPQLADPQPFDFQLPERGEAESKGPSSERAEHDRRALRLPAVAQGAEASVAQGAKAAHGVGRRGFLHGLV